MIKLLSLIPQQHLKENLDTLKNTLKNKYPGLQLQVHNMNSGKPNEYIYLSRIIVPNDVRNEGMGTKVMLELIKYADSKGRMVTLSPTNEWGASISKLKRFYKRFGFVENKGKYIDYEISDDMYRLPK